MVRSGGKSLYNLDSVDKNKNQTLPFDKTLIILFKAMNRPCSPSFIKLPTSSKTSVNKWSCWFSKAWCHGFTAS